jgi:hypothetical protein
VSGRRVSTLVVVGLLVAAAAVSAVLLNLVLLGRAAAPNDPVGLLTPRANLPAAPQWTIRPTTGPVEGNGADD